MVKFVDVARDLAPEGPMLYNERARDVKLDKVGAEAMAVAAQGVPRSTNFNNLRLNRVVIATRVFRALSGKSR